MRTRTSTEFGRTLPRWRRGTSSGSTRHGRRPSPNGRAVGRRTARENVADLVDDGSFVEYGPVVIAAQRRRRPVAGPHRTNAGRRHDRRDRHRQRPPVRGPRGAGRRCVVRLHRACWHAGPAEPPQEGPFVRAGRNDASARGVLHRRRGRPSRRHRRNGCQRARLLGVQLLRSASAGWCRSSGSTPGTASPAMRRSSAAAMS